MTDESKFYGATDIPAGEVPDGFERIALVQDDVRGGIYYQVEAADGTFHLCDADGDTVSTVSSWTLLRYIADIPADDSDAFFEAIEATAKRQD